MGRSREDEAVGAWLLSFRFLESGEFAVAFVSALTLVGLGVPLLLFCYRHVLEGHVAIGCSFGALGVAVVGISGWTLSSSLRRARTAFRDRV